MYVTVSWFAVPFSTGFKVVEGMLFPTPAEEGVAFD